MEKLSVAIITFNEERNIARALHSVDFADEIVVVDSFSSDTTVAIVKEYTDKVFSREFEGHVKQKNHALSLTSNDWVLCIDADEEVTKELREEIQSVLDGDDKKSGYKIPRRTFYLWRWINRSGWYPDLNIRLINKNHARWGGVDPHDKMELDGECGTLTSDLLHYPYKDFAHHIDTINRYTTVAANRLFESGKRAGITDITIRPFFTFFKKFFLKLGFLDGLAGFVIAVSTAVYTFSKYMKLCIISKERSDDKNNR